jgi:hypothetical protein
MHAVMAAASMASDATAIGKAHLLPTFAIVRKAPPAAARERYYAQHACKITGAKLL